MKQNIDFDDFEEARQRAGLFFDRMKTELDISERTYYRWKARGSVPLWAMRLVELLGGDLSAHGWQHWRIERGVLYCARLNARYHQWTPETLLAGLYEAKEPLSTPGRRHRVEPSQPARATTLKAVDSKSGYF